METGGVIVPIPYGEGVNGINMLDAGNDATGSRVEDSTSGSWVNVSFVIGETGLGISGTGRWGGTGDDNQAFQSNDQVLELYRNGSIEDIRDAVFNYVTTVLRGTENEYNWLDFQSEFSGCFNLASES